MKENMKPQSAQRENYFSASSAVKFWHYFMKDKEEKMRKKSIGLILGMLIFFLCAQAGISEGAAFAAKALPSEVLFQDDFSEGLTDRWTVVDSGTNSDPSNWHVSEGVLVEDSNIWSGEEAGPTSAYLGTYIYAGNSSWANYKFSVRLCPEDNDGIGVLFRYIDKDNYYFFFMVEDGGSGGPFRALQKKVDGVFSTLKFDDWEYEEDRWYDINIIVEESSIEIYMDDDLVFNVNDDSLSQGGIGLFAYAMNEAYFNDVKVTSVDTVSTIPTPVPGKDAFRLSTGELIVGELLSFDGSIFKIKTEEGIVEKTREEVTGILLGITQQEINR